ncbi:M12 family metallopeptidase [Paludibacterium paludis]|uniref:Peptidase M12A domain-containing protein n=1 Tax=Paludibacterium paludis TaxID=1225769 RepID=A0A918P1W0_9NEIS|nr:M12 family metallopeptidase [Paludibacterium paludis]GGY13150.1 hypothetical protein GCM10011289_15450 [Paludibacterium paludis]
MISTRTRFAGLATLLALGGAAADVGDTPSRQRRALVHSSQALWPNGVIPYEYAEDYPEEGRRQFESAAEAYRRQTGILFLPRQGESHRLVLRPHDTLCGTGAGKSPYPIEIFSMSRSCAASLFYNLHEMGHAAGLLHEHQRSDRDRYVTLGESNWLRHTYNSARKLTEYDRDSVMQYPPPLVHSRDPAHPIHSQGEPHQLSALDVVGLAKLYPESAKRVTDRNDAFAAGGGRIVSLEGDQCLSRYPGGRVELTVCQPNHPAQAWRFGPTGEIVNAMPPALCLAVVTGGRPGRALLQPCTGSYHQRWAWKDDRLHLAESSTPMALRRFHDGTVGLDRPTRDNGALKTDRAFLWLLSPKGTR